MPAELSIDDLGPDRSDTVSPPATPASSRTFALTPTMNFPSMVAMALRYV
jgi:hypothetical protein